MLHKSRLLKHVLYPFKLYIVFLTFQNPLGFVLLNIVTSFKAHYEFSEIHGQILNCVLADVDGGKKIDFKIQQKILHSLIEKLNSRRFTFSVSLVMHLAAMCCDVNTVGFVLSLFNVLVFFVKVYKFHHFMINNPEPSFQKYLADPNVQRDALVVSCLSLFLELFGHIFIQILSCVMYITYVIEPRLLELAIVFTLASDIGRKEIGMRFGRFPFAKFVKPQMRYEGAVLAVFSPYLLAFVMDRFKKELGFHMLAINI